VLTRLLGGSITTGETARELGLSERQVRRLKAALLRGGPRGLVHGNRGRRPAHRLPDELRALVVKLATTVYAGYSETRLSELLREREQISVSSATIRRILREAGIPKRQTSRAIHLPASAMPVAFNLSQRRMLLLDLRGADFREPGFQQTIERWHKEQPQILSLELDLRDFPTIARREPGRIPDGFVFHVGRCGETLVSSVLSWPDEHLVIKNSSAVNALLTDLLHDEDGRASERENLTSLALPFMFRHTRGTVKRLLFLLSSWNLRLASTLLRLFPSTPAVFIARQALPVVASLLSRPPGWQNLASRPRLIQARFFPSLASVPPQLALAPATFYAHTWRSGMEAALSLPRSRVLVVAFDELLAAPVPSLMRILRHFGLCFDQESIAAVFGPRASALREAAGSGASLPGEQEALVQGVAEDLYERLTAHSR
jgi:hypothetical protein